MDHLSFMIVANTYFYKIKLWSILLLKTDLPTVSSSLFATKSSIPATSYWFSIADSSVSIEGS
jgi:hypothetical protein